MISKRLPVSDNLIVDNNHLNLIVAGKVKIKRFLLINLMIDLKANSNDSMEYFILTQVTAILRARTKCKDHIV